MIKVSIIITVHNTKEYLKKCLDSVVFQTLKEIEIFVVDDASDDDPQSLITSEYNDERLRFIRLETSRGPGGARNAALSLCKGEFIAFLDSDDWLDLNFYEKLYLAASAHQAEIAMAGLVRSYDYETSNKVYKCFYAQEHILNGDIAFRIMTGEYEVGIKVIPSALNKIYHSSFLKTNELLFLEDIYFEDQLFSYQTLLSSKKIVCVPETFYHHYKRNGSIVQSFQKKNVDDMVYAYKNIRAYLESNKSYKKYMEHYYRSLDHFYNLIVRQIFEFVPSEDRRKQLLCYSFEKLQEIVQIKEYIQYSTSENIRRHLQPDITDTTIH